MRRRDRSCGRFDWPIILHWGTDMGRPICFILVLIVCCLALAGPKVTNIVISFDDGSEQRVSVASTQPAPVPTTQTRERPFLGVNLESLRDYDRQFMFIDAMKTSRRFGSALKPYDGQATLDADGWPTGDA